MAAGASQRRVLSAAWVVLGFAVFFALYFAPGLGEGRLLAPNDGIYHNLPVFYGERALWTTRLFAGYPAGADPQEMLWYPPARVFGLVPAPWGWNAFVVAGYAIAGAAAYAFALALTGSRGAAIAGGLVYASGG